MQIKEKKLAENKVKFTKFIPSDNVQFVKQVPAHHREKFIKAIAARLKNKKLPPPLHPRERLKQKVAALEKDLKQKTAELEDEPKLIKVVLHILETGCEEELRNLKIKLFLLNKFQVPRDRLKRKIKKCNKPYDVHVTKIAPVHPRERLRRILEQKAKEQELPVFLDDEVEIMKVQPVHPRERLQIVLKQNTDEVEITKVQPMHPRERLREHLQKKPEKFQLTKKCSKI